MKKHKSKIIITITSLLIFFFGISLLLGIFIKQAADSQIIEINKIAPILAPTKTPSQQNSDQGKSDLYFSSEERKFLEKYPWYNNLPKKTTNYFIAFDPSNESFIGDIYSNAENKELIKKEAVNYLKSIGVDINKFKISWSISSNPSPTPVSE